MTELKREYVVPLRKKSRFAPKWRRSKKAVSVLKEFIEKHMKTDNVLVCRELNEKLWENGIQNPPGKVSVIALKTTINGVEKTYVNLTEFGVDKYINPENVIEKTAKKEKVAAEVKDAEVSEKEDVSAEPKKKVAKKSAKKEVTKDE